MKYISPVEIVAFTEDGVHSMAMEAGVPVELPDHMIPALVAQGARPYEGDKLVGSATGSGLEDPVDSETPAPVAKSAKGTKPKVEVAETPETSAEA